MDKTRYQYVKVSTILRVEENQELEKMAQGMKTNKASLIRYCIQRVLPEVEEIRRNLYEPERSDCRNNETTSVEMVNGESGSNRHPETPIGKGDVSTSILETLREIIATVEETQNISFTDDARHTHKQYYRHSERAYKEGYKEKKIL